MPDGAFRQTIGILSYAAITAVLGGSKTLKRKVDSDSDLTVLAREGLPVDTLTLLAHELSIERKTLARVVGISDRTLSRRSRRTSASRPKKAIAPSASPASSPLRLILWAPRKGILLAANPEPRPRWPASLDLLDSDTGAKSVETVLARIEYGIYS